MPTTTTTYSFNKPVVGADEDDWGGYLNGNWDSVDDLLDGTTPITGIDINSGTLDGVTIGGTTAGAGTFTTLTANTSITGTLATAAQPNVTSLGTLTSLTVSGDVSFGDNDKAIFGAGSDLQIYHDGFASYINDGGIGSLKIRADQLRIESADGSETLAVFNQNSDVFLRHDNTTRLATTSTGVDITGTLTSDGLTVDTSVDGNISTFKGDLNYFYIKGSGADTILSTVGSGGNASNLFFQTDPFVSEVNRMQINKDGDISFYEDTGTTAKFFWDASAESLVVGASSTATVFEATGSKNDQWAGKFTNTNTGGYGVLAITAGSTANERAFEVRKNTSDTAMLIDGSGNVGIGTSSPIYAADIKTSGTNNGQLRVGGAATSATGLLLEQTNSGSTTANIQNSYYSTSASASLSIKSGYTTFHTGTSGSEAMRIDASGNLLVGMTTPSNLTTGFAARANSLSSFCRDTATADAAVLALNKKTGDGDIVIIQKDGSTVGSIGAHSTQTYIGTGDTGLYFNAGNDSIDPYNTSTPVARSDAISLGAGSRRFKDLYLSGGVYLGGTGSANKLDDYEFGSYNPTLSGFTGSITLNSSYDTLAYTRIGNQVTVTGLLVPSAVSSPSGDLYISLPFVAANLADASERTTPSSVFYFNGGGAPNGGTYYNTALRVNVGGVSSFRIFAQGQNGVYDTSPASWVGAGSDFEINLTYFTTA